MRDTHEPDSLNPRQRAVLEHALNLLVAGGEKALTTAGLARAANCSKESLYKWFGDRDGLLAAMISHQASKVRSFVDTGATMSADAFRFHLSRLAEDLLLVLSGEVSLALNRLAIGQASREGNRLGNLMVAQGRRRIEQGTKALLTAGRRAGLVEFDDLDDTYRSFYGLVVRDTHVRMLLGEIEATSLPISQQSEQAIKQFFTLFGAGGERDGVRH